MTTNESKAVRITPQAVGAYGERAVEAELLRRGWIASNVNASVKNAADFDIFAFKNGRTVHIRVKTAGPGMHAFQFSGRLVDTNPDVIGELDFAVLVNMGGSRELDEFYVLPTRILLETILQYRKAYLAQARRDGNARKDVGHWTLHLETLKTAEERLNYGLRERWQLYRSAWEVLTG